MDFIVYGGDGFWALEVKNSAKVRPEDLRGLRSFRSDYPESTALLLHRGEERSKVDGIWCLPLEDFLRRLLPSESLFHPDRV